MDLLVQIKDSMLLLILGKQGWVNLTFEFHVMNVGFQVFTILV